MAGSPPPKHIAETSETPGTTETPGISARPENKMSGPDKGSFEEMSPVPITPPQRATP